MLTFSLISASLAFRASLAAAIFFFFSCNFADSILAALKEEEVASYPSGQVSSIMDDIIFVFWTLFGSNLDDVIFVFAVEEVEVRREGARRSSFFNEASKFLLLTALSTAEVV